MTSERRELLYNGSGYFDGTAFRAIIDLKEDANMNAEGGDIWTMQKSDGSVREVLILARHGNYVSILQLVDRESVENSVDVSSRCRMFADAGRISYAYVDYLLDYVKTLADEDFIRIMASVIRMLTIDLPEGSASALPKVIPEDEELHPIVVDRSIPSVQSETPGSAYEKLKEKYRAMEIELAQTVKERDVYKELFYKAFPQMGGGIA